LTRFVVVIDNAKTTMDENEIAAEKEWTRVPKGAWRKQKMSEKRGRKGGRGYSSRLPVEVEGLSIIQRRLYAED
jgi:hypothetical protein